MPHYYSEKQTSPTKIRKITVIIDNMQFELYSASGIFSGKKLDKGSRLLIEEAQIKKGDRVLDLGCGIGVVGISIKMLHPTTDILMTDINERAIEVANKNVADMHLDIETRKSNMYEKIDETFDVILLNPPQTAGKDVCFAMIEHAPEHLVEGGTLQLVARHNKGGKSLEKQMKEVFGNVEQIAKSGGYRVYVSRK